MLMYQVSEYEILTTWSIETLLKKIEHGIDFELARRGVVSETEEDNSEVSPEELKELEELYS